MTLQDVLQNVKDNVLEQKALDILTSTLCEEEQEKTERQNREAKKLFQDTLNKIKKIAATASLHIQQLPWYNNLIGHIVYKGKKLIWMDPYNKEAVLHVKNNPDRDFIYEIMRNSGWHITEV